MKTRLFLIYLALACNSFASEVKWNCFQLSEFIHYDSVGVGCYYYYSDSNGITLATPEVGLCYTMNPAGNKLIQVDGNGPCNAGDNASLWVLAYAEDTLNPEYFNGSHTVLKSDHPHIKPTSVGDTFDIVTGESFYLAVIGSYIGYDWVDENYNYYGESERNYYAWVELQSTGTELEIVSSAFSLSPLIVGGGLATPEPSSAMLVLLGIAALTLRRNRSP